MVVVRDRAAHGLHSSLVLLLVVYSSNSSNSRRPTLSYQCRCHIPAQCRLPHLEHTSKTGGVHPLVDTIQMLEHVVYLGRIDRNFVKMIEKIDWILEMTDIDLFKGDHIRVKKMEAVYKYLYDVEQDYLELNLLIEGWPMLRIICVGILIKEQLAQMLRDMADKIEKGPS